jgi:hypothetical protein
LLVYLKLTYGTTPNDDRKQMNENSLNDSRHAQSKRIGEG